MAGTDVAQGTQFPLDAAYILNLLANNKLTERGQDMSYQQALLQYYAGKAQAEDQYALDVEQLGQNAAQLNFQQRNADALNELQRQSGVLGRDTLNFQQRDAAAGKKMSIIDMLNSRSGPGNALRYDALIEALDPPKADRQTTLDPYAILEGLVRESDAFSQPVGSVSQPYGSNIGARQSSSSQSTTPSWLLEKPQPMSSIGAGGGGGGGIGTGFQAPNTAYPQGQAFNITGQGPEDIFSGIRNQDVADLGSGQGKYWQTGSAGPSKGKDYTNFKVFNPYTNTQYGAEDDVPANTNVWINRLGEGGTITQADTRPEGWGQLTGPAGGPRFIPRMADGGMVRPPAPTAMAQAGPPMAMVGDGTGARPNPDSEIAMALVNAVTGQPELKVLNPGQTRRMMRRGVRPFRAAGGGTYGGYNTGNTVEVSDYGKEALGNQGFIQRLFGKGQRPAFQKFGASLSNDKIGVSDAPSMINLQKMAGLLPSQRAATQELYEFGLDTDFQDILARGQRSTPNARGFKMPGYGF